MKLLKGDLKDQLQRCRQAQYALTGALLLVAAGLYLLEIRPAVRQLDEVHKQYARAQWTLQQEQAETGKLPEVLKNIEELQQRVERFDKKLPKHLDLSPFIADIHRISEESSLKGLVEQPDTKPQRTDQFGEVPIKFTFKGDFQTGVMAFLRRTEDMQRLTRIQKLDIKADDAHDGQVNAELTMNIYYAEE
jgi:Tfp pilus assembly protein PilO